MSDMARELAVKIAQVGLKQRSFPSIHDIEAFSHFFTSDG